MKKIISLLVALAMVLSLSVTAFAVTGGFQDDPVVIETLEGGFEMTAGTNYLDYDVYFKYVAEKSGTIMTDAECNVWFALDSAYNFTWATSGDTSIDVNAGDVVYINICNYSNTSDYTAMLYYEGEEPSGGNTPGGDAGAAVPNGGALALGNNNVTVNYATMPMMAAKWTYTATETGFLTVTVASVNGNANLGMPFGRGMYAVYAGESDGMGTNTVTVFANAGDVINIAVTDSMDMDPVPAVLNLTFEAGTPVVERDPADYFQTAPNGDFLLESLTEAVEIFVGGNGDIYFTYTAEADGTLALTSTVDGYAGTNCAIKVNSGSWSYNVYSAEVSAGDTVRINIWSGFEGTAILLSDGGNAGGGEPGGNAPTGLPSGSALALGNNDVSITYAMMPMQAPYWTYTATEGGNLTVTVSSINGNSMLGMPFGMGMYTLVVGETDGQYTNTATVYLNAGDSVNIAVLDTMEDMGVYVPAVINLAFAAGEPVEVKDPADYFTGAGSEDDPYIINSLAEAVEIFGAGNDVYFKYIAESAGTITLTAADNLEGYAATNSAIKVNDGSWTFNIPSVTVAAGDVVMFNIWGGYEGTVAMGEGGSTESTPMSGEDVAVEDTESIDVFFTPDADGILTVTISANPGFRFWVYNAVTDASLTLPENDVSGTYTYELVGGVEYRICMIGYHDWAEADATITYDITFQAGEISSNVENLDISDVELVIGEQNVALLPNAITTLFNFAAPEAGIYTVTIPNDAIAELYSLAWTSYQLCEGNTLVFTATDAEQGFLIGLTSESDSMTIKIEKTGNYTPAEQIVYEEYEAIDTPVESVDVTEEDLVNVDISVEQTVVVDEDGFYHLGTVDGPLVYVNLNTDQFTLAALYNAGAPIHMRGSYEDESGLYNYDFMSMITSNYYNYSTEYDFHPLNTDLMIFLQGYGTTQGWFNPGTSAFDIINEGEFNEDSAWLAGCYILADAEIPEQTPDSGNGGNAQTGDMGVIGAAIAMTVSAIGGVAVVAKKKEF